MQKSFPKADQFGEIKICIAPHVHISSLAPLLYIGPVCPPSPFFSAIETPPSVCLSALAAEKLRHRMRLCSAAGANGQCARTSPDLPVPARALNSLTRLTPAAVCTGYSCLCRKREAVTAQTTADGPSVRIDWDRPCMSSGVRAVSRRFRFTNARTMTWNVRHGLFAPVTTD